MNDNRLLLYRLGRGERELTLRADGVGCLRCGEIKEERAVVLLQWLEDEDALLQLEV